MFKSAKTVLAAAILFSFFWISWKTIDPDLGWHLKVGQWILENRAAPRADLYSYTMPGFKWVYHEWPVGAALFWLKANNVWRLAALIFALIWSAPFLVWLKRSKTWFSLLIISPMAVMLLNMVGVRPQAISFLLFFAVFEILYSAYRSSSSVAHRLWLLPLIFLVWANLHGGFAAGLGLWLFWILLRALVSRRVHNHELLLFAISAGATFINPYGTQLHGEILRVILSREAARYIVEWQPAILADNWEFAAPFSLVVGMFIFLLIKFFRKYPIHISAAAILLLAMFLKSVRMMPLFFTSALPIFNLGEQFARAEIKPTLAARPLPRRIAASFAVAIATVACLIIFLWFQNVSKTIKPTPYPERAISYLRELNSRGELKHLLNSYGWGGYIINTAPEIKVFIDGRMPHWVDDNGNSAMKDYIKVFYDRTDGWQDVFVKWNIDTVLIANRVDKKQNDSVVTRYLHQVGWLKRLVIFVKKQNKNIFDLKTELLASNWRVAYEDKIAVVLRCDEQCW